jgi:hypothetical protein
MEIDDNNNITGCLEQRIKTILTIQNLSDEFSQRKKSDEDTEHRTFFNNTYESALS